MPEFTDQLNRKITLTKPAQRIISLVPSQTELLYDLGLREEIAGITKFCIHPEEWFRTKPRIGGTKKIDFDKIHSLNPDLIIGNKEENDQSQVEELMKHYPVWMSDIRNLGDALEMITRLGDLAGKTENAYEMKNTIELNFLNLNTQISNLNTQYPLLNTTYLIWQKPLMTIGHDTFIHDMLTRCGFANAFSDRSRYPEIQEEEILASDSNLILLSSEPYPFKEAHVKRFMASFPKAKVCLVDGEFFSWYGSRLLKAPEYFHSLIEQIKAGD